MEIFLSAIGALGTLTAVIIAAIQLRRTPKPKPEPEPVAAGSLTIMGVSMHRGSDLYGNGRRSP